MASNQPQSFGLDISKFVAKAKTAPEHVVRKVGLDLTASVVRRSPVDTGRFRANWNLSIGRMDTLTTPATDKSGRVAVERARVLLNGWQVDQDIYLTNSLPYAIPLEYGHSQKQAPHGMVRITVAEFQTFVNAAAAEVSK